MSAGLDAVMCDESREHIELESDSIEKYDQVLAAGPDLATHPARSHDVCFGTNPGFTVVDVCDSEEAFAKFGEVLGPVLQQVGLEGQPKIYPLHNTL